MQSFPNRAPKLAKQKHVRFANPNPGQNPGSVCIIVTISRRPLAFRSMNRNIAFGIFLLTLFHGRVRT